MRFESSVTSLSWIPSEAIPGLMKLPGFELYLLLDGVIAVEVDGKALAEVRPGAILGERALLEGGRRTATLRAVTPCRVAVAAADQLAPEALAEVAREHRREERVPGSRGGVT